MSQKYLVQVGVMGAVGCFQSVDWSAHHRDDRVICRTVRGMEVGRVLARLDSSTREYDGELIRRMSVEDHMLSARLEKHRDEAFEACQSLLQQNASDAVLVDVEHLFDGQSVYFYFLGDVDSHTQMLTDRLAESYAKTVKFRQFSDALVEGCGPDCGTEAASGCGDSCSGCAVAIACSQKGPEAAS